MHSLYLPLIAAETNIRRFYTVDRRQIGYGPWYPRNNMAVMSLAFFLHGMSWTWRTWQPVTPMGALMAFLGWYQRRQNWTPEPSSWPGSGSAACGVRRPGELGLSRSRQQGDTCKSGATAVLGHY